MIRCEWCDADNRAVDGWHYGAGGERNRYPCSVAPPRVAQIITDPSVLTREELDALLLVNECLGPVVLDTTEVPGGDYL